MRKRADRRSRWRQLFETEQNVPSPNILVNIFPQDAGHGADPGVSAVEGASRAHNSFSVSFRSFTKSASGFAKVISPSSRRIHLSGQSGISDTKQRIDDLITTSLETQKAIL